jgi:hypothetical protein
MGAEIDSGSDHKRNHVKDEEEYNVQELLP